MPFVLDPLYLASALAVVFILEIVLFIWLLRVSRHYNSLVRGLTEKTLMSFLEGLQKTLANNERTLAVTKKDLAKLETDAKVHLQHLMLKRFNPFSDTGGDQSFILALLDGNKDGVVITSLHSRENTRFYVKSVKGGTGIGHPLSKDEEKIVNIREK